MRLERRELIKLAALSAASGLAASLDSRGLAVEWREEAADLPDLPDVQWDKAPCRFCGTGCHVQVGVQDGKVVAIAGDKNAEVNKGLLCVKGYHVGLALYGEDRLTRPLLRKNGELVPISWDEAIDVVARRIMASGKKFGFYISGQSTIPEGYAAQKLMRAGLGNPHLEGNARLCMASAVTGFLSTYGVDEPASCFDDLEACDTFITWGNNPAEMHPVLFSRIVDRIARGEKVEIVDIGCRRTRTTERADHFLLMHPHADVAIANGIMAHLLATDRYDHDFVEKHCHFRAERTPPSEELEGHDAYAAWIAEEGPNGLFGEPIDFAQFRSLVSHYTPERVSEISGVPVAQLEALNGIFADPERRIVSVWCMGANQHTVGTRLNDLLHGIHLLSGHWGRPGDGPQSLTGQPSACGTVREVGTLAHALPGGRLLAKEEHRSDVAAHWKVPLERVPSQPGYHTVEMFRRFCTPTDAGGDIDTIWVQVTNPGQSLPNAHDLFLAKKELEDKFLIVSDVYPTATTALADLVLPSAMWVEKNGVYGNSERRTQQWFRMVSPPGEARDDCWQTLAVARRLHDLGHPGLKDEEGHFLFRITDEEGQEVPFWQWEHYYDLNVDRVLFEEYRPLTFKKHKHVAPYDELTKARGLRWPVVEGPAGEVRETRWRFVEGSDPFVEEGKGIDFYHSVTDDGRALVWLHPFEEPAELPDDEYPYLLSTGRVLEHWHTGSMTMRMPPLQRAMPAAYVEMHPEDARREGLRNGSPVAVATRRGRIVLPVWFGGRAKPARKHLFIGFFDESVPINELTLDAVDPYSKQPDYKKSAAKLARVDRESDR